LRRGLSVVRLERSRVGVARGVVWDGDLEDLQRRNEVKAQLVLSTCFQEFFWYAEAEQLVICGEKKVR
jgi:hypothetical protein